MRSDIADLPWLPAPPDDFRRRCRALDAADPGLDDKLRLLSQCAMDIAQSSALAKAVVRLRTEGAAFASFAAVRLGLLPAHTFDAVAQMLPAVGLRHGLILNVTLAPADQIQQQAMDPGSAINSNALDYVLLAFDHRWLSLDALCIDPGSTEQRLAEACATIGAVVETITQNNGATVIVPTMPVPAGGLFGSFDRRVPGTPRAMVDRVNRSIVTDVTERNAPLLDVAELTGAVGGSAWFDDRLYHLYKIPFALDFVPIYCDYVCRLLAGLRGRARKCLVLDLDNSIWGGAIGDDGIDGIVLGTGNAAGEAYLAVQRTAAELKTRGIILAVCSKNDDAVAREPFRSHPDMILREADIAVFQANWSDKASNIEAIAKTLDIGLDSLVFFDDNPVERATVRMALPMVAIPELPSDPTSYARILLAAGYFEAVAFSDEDRGRSASYAANAQRAEVMHQARDIGEYLASLEMEISCAPFEPLARARITQLINKSNQFNLTTRRYTEGEIAALEDGDNATFYFRLRDRFGDFGIIGIIICRPVEEADATWAIDTWLMSCRVLSRRIDEAMLAALVREARARGIVELQANYLPTPKNGIVREHYDALGFALIAETSDGSKAYRFAVADYAELRLPIRQAS